MAASWETIKKILAESKPTIYYCERCGEKREYYNKPLCKECYYRAIEPYTRKKRPCVICGTDISGQPKYQRYCRYCYVVKHRK